MRIRPLTAEIAVLIFALTMTACSTEQSNATLAPGMTTAQAVQAMGQPDLKDSVPDPNHSGATVPRYAWLDAGKVAVFGPDNRVASIQQIEPSAQTRTEVESRNAPPRSFDPLETPLNYTFFPIRAAFIYIGAGLNCVAGAGCQKPQLPDPSHG